MAEPGPGAQTLMAGLARLDTRPETIEAMQRGLEAAWAALEVNDWRIAP